MIKTFRQLIETPALIEPIDKKQSFPAPIDNIHTMRASGNHDIEDHRFDDKHDFHIVTTGSVSKMIMVSRKSDGKIVNRITGTSEKPNGLRIGFIGKTADSTVPMDKVIHHAVVKHKQTLKGDALHTDASNRLYRRVLDNPQINIHAVYSKDKDKVKITPDNFYHHITDKNTITLSPAKRKK